MENLQENFVEFLVDYGPKVLGAIVVLIIGLWIIGRISKLLKKSFDRREMDASLRSFLVSMIGVLLKVLLVISVMSMVGIAVTSFIAILGAAGLAVGLALSGTLQNFAGGVILLLFKPFKVGDFITAEGYSGTVEEIQIFVTFLKTPQNVTIIIPNSGLATNSLTNFSAKPIRRVDWSFGIAYGDSYDKAKEVLLKLIQEDDRILKDPEPFIALGELADSSVEITTRVWVNAADFWGVFFDMNEKVYKAFEKEGINIPFPQMDVHLHKEN
ncbi:MAG: mechanosensitive ion channel family protein [Bacteroidetes bacterium]|nr:MAG: mechanosensitive ion channel family protein [Bacteroidota bacterium]